MRLGPGEAPGLGGGPTTTIGPWRPAASRPWLKAVLVALLLLWAGWLRTQHSGYGLPYILGFDEHTFVLRGLTIAAGELQFSWEGHATSTTPLFLGACYRLAFLAQRAGGEPLFQAWAGKDWSGPRTTVRIGRLACGLLDTATVLLVLLVGLSLGLGFRYAFLAALLYGSSAQAIHMAHQVRMDLLMSFFFVAASLAALAVLHRGRWRDYLAGGWLSGLSFASKWPGGLALAGVVLAHLAAGRLDPGRRSRDVDARLPAWLVGLALVGVGMAVVALASGWEHRWMDTPFYREIHPAQRDGAAFLKRNLVLAGALAAIGGVLVPLWTRWRSAVMGVVASGRFRAAAVAFAGAFVAATPTIVSDWPHLVQSAVHHARSRHPPADGTPGLDNLCYYLFDPIWQDLTGIGFGLAVVGTVVIVMRRRVDDLVVFAPPALLLGYFSLTPLRWWHYAVPLSPYLSLLAAIGVARLVERLPDRWAPVAVALLAAVPVWAGGVTAAGYGQEPTQLEATRWFAAHVPPGKGVRVLVEGYGILVSPARYRVMPVQSVGLVGLERLTPTSVDYVVVSEAMAARFLAQPGRYPDQVAAYTWIRDRWKPEKIVAGRPGPLTPTIWIYKVQGQPRA
ncbi:MAG: glycosyltransferase family 39 protein [Candidatus Riflebacteria bacterium]|nr:glycosyltransferase family 39 protein [Candidatus Riflebacteria bacterium]